MNKKKDFAVMVNGLPGKMATKVYEHLLNVITKKHSFLGGVRLVSLTGPEIGQKQISINGTEIQLIKPNERKKKRWFKNIPTIAVDFSHPSAVIENAKFYCSQGMPFVMGTTGGDREKLEEIVKKSQNCAVIAPNMAKQVVAFQAMMEFAANNFSDAFRGYSLEIVESHQKGKADTSGTAKAMVKHFNDLGISFSKEQIVMVRDVAMQLYLGIPEEALKGHGWHTYTLCSSDNNILFRFTHNVNGRDIYAAGTLDAIKFLSENIKPGKIYSMIDVLKGQ